MRDIILQVLDDAPLFFEHEADQITNRNYTN